MGKIIDIRTKTTANANVAYAIVAGLENMLFFSVNNLPTMTSSLEISSSNSTDFLINWRFFHLIH